MIRPLCSLQLIFVERFRILSKMLYLCIKIGKMKYRLKKETKPKLPTFGKYKAVAVHNQVIGSKQITKEVAKEMGVSEGDVLGVMLSLSTVINRHLRNGDKVKLESWGTMKLEIESEKVDNLKDFRAKKHIRGVRLHFLPESENGSPELYKDIPFDKDKTFAEE